MSSFRKHVKKDKVKWIVTFVLISVLVLSMVYAFVRIDRNTETKTLGTTGITYAIGVVDEEGKIDTSDNSSIVTRNMYTIDGLKCEIAEDATITYKIAFYDKDGKFLAVSDELSEDFNAETLEEGVSSFRVIITPIDDADGVGTFEVSSYASQLTVTYNYN